MNTVERLAMLLPEASAARLEQLGGALREARLRSGRAIQLVHAGGEEFVGGALSSDRIGRIAAALMDYSIYAREEDLKQGFFTLEDGSRAGVCGELKARGDALLGMTAIGSLCVRIARECPGCADEAVRQIAPETGVRSALLISEPGMGKTTLLRDIARSLSGRFCVAVADERSEIAACVGGVPTLDVGPRTDVMSGCPKHIAVERLIRSMAPRVIITDEIGDDRDARVLADAVRCGVAVVASAHAGSFEALEQRSALSGLLRRGLFDVVIRLGERPGRIVEIRRWTAADKEGGLWRCA